MRLGLISDTHGLLRPEALAALAGSEAIVHAGDIGDAAILARLAQIAPVTAVRGNNDFGPWALQLRATAHLDAAGSTIHVLHDLALLAIDPAASGIAVVIAGHSHQPRIETRDGVLFVNPGSAGPRRFRLPITVGRLDVTANGVHAEIVTLMP
jgi:putative phosphoesterase